jgi:adenylylsulfate kinase-like enzyme
MSKRTIHLQTVCESNSTLSLNLEEHTIIVHAFEPFREDRCSNTNKIGHKEHIQIYNLAYITVCFRTIVLS